ncbi:MAG: hypothetical protein JXA95_06160 [Spirochaetales bacterium]|nr:hypothetical protein [Spirochaetales bacterium]
MIILVDCNSFYVSSEKVFRPDLRDKPVMVLSNNDGCVVVLSSEAKKAGIARGEGVLRGYVSQKLRPYRYPQVL